MRTALGDAFRGARPTGKVVKREIAISSGIDLVMSEKSGHHPSSFARAIPCRSARVMVARVTVGHVTVGHVTVGRATVGRATVGRVTVGRVTVGRVTAGRVTVGRVTVGRVTVGRVTVGRSYCQGQGIPHRARAR